MRDFLFNLSLLAAAGIILFIAFPSLMKQIYEAYSVMGFLPFIIIAVILSALPRRSRRRR
jgi:hypothetical protein